MLSLELLDVEDIPGNESVSLPKSSQSAHPTDFLATYYDYSNNRAVMATGPIHDPECISVSDSDTQPLPSAEEFELAVSLVEDHPELGCLLRENRVRPYRAMPALIETELPDGCIERTLAVGLLPVKEDSGDGTAESLCIRLSELI